MSIFKRWFWRDAFERACKTAAQSAVVVLGGDVVSAWATDWAGVAGAAVGGFALSILTSVASKRVGDPSTASLTV